MNIGFLGAGNMGSAIIKCILAMKNDELEVYAFDKDEVKLSELSKIGVVACKSEKELAERCKYVFLAVKPQVMDIVLEEIADNVTEETVLVSIAAGITETYIKSKTKPYAKVILVMPNTPFLLGEGATSLAKAEPTSSEEFEFVKNIFAAGGAVAEIPKDKMKEIIAINGSSPAFIYLFAKGFLEYAKSVGIDEEQAKVLISQSLIGSAKMITESGQTIDELIKAVSSPGGTTLAGLDKFYEGNLTEVVGKACENCTKRAYELSAEK